MEGVHLRGTPRPVVIQQGAGGEGDVLPDEGELAWLGVLCAAVSTRDWGCCGRRF